MAETRVETSKVQESKTADNPVFHVRSISLTSTKTIVYLWLTQRKPSMRMRTRVAWGIAMLAVIVSLQAQSPSSPKAAADDSQVRPPVTEADLQIVKQATKILDSPSKWNRADNRVCPPDAKVFSLYCALEKATTQVGSHFEHRGAAMQEARFVIDEIAPHRNYDHRLMGYNNDPSTTFADIQKVLHLLEDRVAQRLKVERSQTSPQSAR